MSRLQTLISRPDGVVEGVNFARLAEIPYFLVTNVPNNTIIVPANQASPPILMSLSGEGPGQVFAWGREIQRGGVIQADAGMRVFLQIQDGQSIRGLMNGACHVDTIAGSGGTPYRLAEALYLDELRAVWCTFTDFSALANSIRFVGLDNRFLDQRVAVDLSRVRARMDRRQYLSMPYWYTLDQGPVTLVAGATGQFPITVGSDHHFKISKFSAVVQEGVGGATGPWTIDIIDITRGESIIDAPQSSHFAVNGNLFFGTAPFPFSWHVPRLIQTNTKLVATITNTHVNPQTFHITLGGVALADRMWR